MTEKGIVPIKDSDLDKFIVRKDKSERKRNPERKTDDNRPIQMTLSDISIENDTHGKSAKNTVAENQRLQNPKINQTIEQS